MEGDDYDVITDLLRKPFSRRNRVEKSEMIKVGRPTPDLKTKATNRLFRTEWYKDFDWLCGSKVSQKLYCWPCLLFQPTASQSWTITGYGNLKNLKSDSKYHSCSKAHLGSYKQMQCFGKYDISTAISEAAKLSKQLHNKEVDENRKYLNHLIDAVLYLGKQGLALRGHDESAESLNKGNYRELLGCFAKIDSVFAARLALKEGSKHFSGVSSTIQNDIIQAIATVVSDEIKYKAAKAPFISVQADETTDCATHAHCTTVHHHTIR